MSTAALLNVPGYSDVTPWRMVATPCFWESYCLHLQEQAADTDQHPTLQITGSFRVTYVPCDFRGLGVWLKILITQIINAVVVSYDAPHSVGLLWTSDRPDAVSSTWQHTTLTRGRHSCQWRDSNPQSQQASGRRPKPSTARPPGSPTP